MAGARPGEAYPGYRVVFSFAGSTTTCGAREGETRDEDGKNYRDGNQDLYAGDGGLVPAVAGDGHFLLRLLSRFEVEGLEHVPDKGPTLITNHLHWLDPPVIMVVFPTGPTCLRPKSGRHGSGSDLSFAGCHLCPAGRGRSQGAARGDWLFSRAAVFLAWRPRAPAARRAPCSGDEAARLHGLSGWRSAGAGGHHGAGKGVSFAVALSSRARAGRLCPTLCPSSRWRARPTPPPSMPFPRYHVPSGCPSAA